MVKRARKSGDQIAADEIHVGQVRRIECGQSLFVLREIFCQGCKVYLQVSLGSLRLVSTIELEREEQADHNDQEVEDDREPVSLAEVFGYAVK